jgi:type I restriction enzyme S subunit
MKAIVDISKNNWLKKIPANWEIFRIKNLFQLSQEKNQGEDLPILSLSQSGIRIRDISTNEGQLAESYENYTRIRPNDLVFNPMDLRSGAIDLSTYDGVISLAYSVLRKYSGINIHLKYFKYYFQWHYLDKIFFPFGQGVSVDHRWTLKDYVLLNFPVLFPPLETQKRIADFLDKETKIIDGLIERKEKLIELLCEKSHALITRVVTKGLDLKAKMKLSGIDWLGDIPRGWEVRRGKFLFRYKKEPNNIYQCDHILALTLKGVINKEDYEARSLIPTDYASYQIFYPDDLVFKLIDLENFQTSRVGIVPEKGIMSPAYLRIIPVAKIAPRFFYWFYYSLYLQGVFNFLGMGVRSALNQHDLLTQSVTLPPPQEQKRIVDFLDDKTTRIDRAVALIESQIEKLKEYRSSLIYSAVTGKIKI